MAIRTIPFTPDEWYHIYNRGVDKRITFESKRDYERFLQNLYLNNTTERLHRSDLGSSSTEKILSIPRSEPLVDVGAFCLMPNHYHLLLKEVRPGGISAFMHKLGTAYTSYFNIKNERTGNLFMKPFRSRHIPDDIYFQHVINYIHCNPAELFEPGWKNGEVRDIKQLKNKLLVYPYSSLAAHIDTSNQLKPILDEKIFEIARQVPPEQMLKEALEYYSQTGKATP